MKRILFIVFSLLTFSLIGCSDDDGPTTPEEKEKGTIVINQTPDVLASAGWTLTGPQNETNLGDTNLTDMPTGEYTITWNSVSGYLTPSGGTQTLAADGTITFNGNYVSDPGGTFVLISPGTFWMGSPIDEPYRYDDETLHEVTLTTSFYMFTTEITNQEYAGMA